MDLASLRAVVAVADTLHFGRAAARLGIAQPQVSQRVRKLESQLGFELFDRDHNRIAMTSAGSRVVAHAREVLAAADRLDRVADGLRAGTAGVVRIGCVGSALFGALTQVLAPVRADLPDVELQVREMESPEQIAALRDGTLDLGFLRPPGPPELDLHDVWHEPMILALPTADPLTDLEIVDAAVLAGRRIMALPRDAGPGYWDQVVTAIADTDAILEPVESADHITTLLGTVALGAGITVVPASLEVVALPGVAYRPLRPAVQMRLSVAAPRSEPSPATAHVLELVTRRA
jgi:LysR family transcriptional regulator, benzoate and cis,cis-muconate-responsive activator of ben and cat genes